MCITMASVMIPAIKSLHRCFHIFVAGLVLLCTLSPIASAQTFAISKPHDCAALSKLAIPGVTSITAERTTENTPQTLPTLAHTLAGASPFCRVMVTSSPETGSAIHTEVWLPEDNWNGRLLGTGNGGGAGRMDYGALAGGLRSGFATANTDVGTAPNALAATAYPARWKDFGYRATHEMTLVAKALIVAYYGEAARTSYFTGCSTGGQQALSEAQRYPADYNGILAGAPANNRTHIHTGMVWQYQAFHKVEGRSALTPELIVEENKAVLQACAGKDGGAPGDSFLTDPRSCKFDPGTLPVCAKDGDSHCFHAEQIDAVKMVYAGASNPRTGERIYESFPFGAEAVDSGFAAQQSPQGIIAGQNYPFHWAMGDAFDALKFDFDKDEDTLDRKLAGILNANNPDLSAFQKAGSKLLMYTGTADALVPYPDALNYYERVISTQGRQHPKSDPLVTTQSFFRYYLVPGMSHCGGGPGLTNVGRNAAPNGELFASLEHWVEQGTAPGPLPASGTDHAKGVPIQRNVCAYPEFPDYTAGDPSLASSFTCKAHPRGEIPVPAARYLR